MPTLTFPPRSLTLLLAVVALATSRPAGVDAQQPAFKSGVDMVPLTVTVTDRAGKHVTGLTGEDFTVLEDGVEQPLSFFASERVPVDVALVLDTSGSMRSDLPLVQSAASGLIRGLRAPDRGTIVEVKGAAGVPQPFTSDLAQIERALRSLATSGETALYDGLYVVLREFERERRASNQIRRQVLVLLSDGVDSASRLSFDDVMDLAQRAGVNIYVITFRGGVPVMPRADPEGSLLRAKYAMGTVARESGGRAFFPKGARELPAIYGAIAQELASQYELGYMPSRPGGDGAFRRVSVRVPPRINALARTRAGYYAPRAGAGM
jgi:Ca-activated chloride channel family protein